MDAETRDILSRRQPGTEQLAQVDYVKAIKPDVVTLTIGGNDIRFPAIARSCVLDSVVPLLDNFVLSYLVTCPVDSNSMRLAEPRLGKRPSWDGLYDRLVKTYFAISKQQSANGQLYVNSYPVPFDNPTHWKLTNRILQTCGPFSATEARQANAMSVRLGDTIYLAVQEANRKLGKTSVHFVDWRPSVTAEVIAGRRQRVAYDSNGLCSSNPASDATMNGLIPPVRPPAG